jgi:type I restriction enzyme S subunit
VVSGSKIYPIKVSVTNLPEQQEITHILDILLEKEQQSKEAAETVLEQIDLMKKAILAKAFRGELG